MTLRADADLGTKLWTPRFLVGLLIAAIVASVAGALAAPLWRKDKPVLLAGSMTVQYDGYGSVGRGSIGCSGASSNVSLG
jgi:hypothetical protein